MNALQARYDAAKSLAVEGGRATLPYFQSGDLHVEWKRDGSPLTLADQASERFIRDEIARRFPNDEIVGEEFGVTTGSSGFRWVLDPIDGTKSFITGVPLYGTMVGLEQDGEAVVGSIYFPGLDEGMFACSGEGAWYFKGTQSPRRAHVSSTSEIQKASIMTTCVPTFAKRNAASQFANLAAAARLSRTWGDVYGYMLVATGRADAMIDPFMNVWDACALLPIIEEAGGRFTDWQAERRIDGGDSIGSNGILHDEIVRYLSSS
jgi:histidinol phosphatase-like enzyme (inositol monophosphatase family)